MAAAGAPGSSGGARDLISRNVLAASRDVAALYPAHKMYVEKFIRSFEGKEDLGGHFGRRKYRALLQKAANRWTETIQIDLDDLEQFAEKEFAKPDEDIRAALGKDAQMLQESLRALQTGIRDNSLRYLKFFFDACVQHFPDPNDDFNTAKTGLSQQTTAAWRRRQHEERAGGAPAGPFPVPAKLMHNFDIRFKPGQHTPVKKLREITAADVGSLVQVDCIVVRASAVKPKAEVATYTCELCGSEIFQIVEGEQFNPAKQCISEKCKARGTDGKLVAQIRTSKFVRYQEMKVQELSAHVPVGGIPKCIDVYLHSDLTRNVLPGDAIRLAGVYTPMASTFARQQTRGTVQDMYIEAHYLDKHKKGYAEQGDDKEAFDAEIDQLAKTGDLYERASKSIGPEIFGHLDIKKVLLLVLVGGMTKKMADGLRIRGDIHILLMGDPGVAKSQLLRQACNIAPRSVYTTGKGSSGVGLTASVARDPSGEVTLEGGALVLADKGICCIDEFDKMEEGDRTAIHEVMEQQTISIAKAGITTTLNARASICAAANPAYGRYNPYKSVTENLRLPESLLSRFDIIFLILDIVVRENDLELARHVCGVHAREGAGDQGVAKKTEQSTQGFLGFKPMSPACLRQYVARARQLEPMIDQTLVQEIAETYVEMRATEDAEKYDSRKSYTTPRALLAMLRLSQAVARARFGTKVEKADFEEAVRLTRVSKESIEAFEKSRQESHPLDTVFEIIQELTKSTADGWVEVEMVNSVAANKGLNEEVVNEALQHYESLSVWTLDASRSHVKFFAPPS
jgi:DNA replication licensing factor MCM7